MIEGPNTGHLLGFVNNGLEASPRGTERSRAVPFGTGTTDIPVTQYGFTAHYGVQSMIVLLTHTGL
jgi:hypothetical protein